MKKRFLAFLCFALVVVAVSSMFVTALATESTGVKGDLNYDGILNSKDYSLLSSYIRSGKGNYELSEVDFNGDGSVNESDKTAMKNTIAINFDINGDNKLNVLDYRMLEKYLAKYDVSKLKNFNLSKCDHNGDGKVNFVDLNQLGYYELFEFFSPPY